MIKMITMMHELWKHIKCCGEDSSYFQNMVYI